MSDEAREASDTLCDVVREYIIDHGCEVVVHVNEVPRDLCVVVEKVAFDGVE